MLNSYYHFSCTDVFVAQKRWKMRPHNPVIRNSNGQSARSFSLEPSPIWDFQSQGFITGGYIFPSSIGVPQIQVILCISLNLAKYRVLTRATLWQNVEHVYTPYGYVITLFDIAMEHHTCL